MDLAENRFGKTWKHFLEVLKVDYNCSLADVCRSISLDLAIESFSFLFITSLVYKTKLQKNGIEVASYYSSLECIS